MEKVTFASLKLKNKIETEKFDFEGKLIGSFI